MKRIFLLFFVTMLVAVLFGCQKTPTATVPPTTVPVTTVPPTTAAPLPTGWVQKDGKTYYYSEQHSMVTGWHTIDGKKYYFTPDGAMATGWTEVDGQNRYFTEEGLTPSGWLELDSKKYYFDAEGLPLTGWQEIDDASRYFTESGALAAGQVEVDGIVRWFGSDGTEVMLVNPWNPMPEGHTPETMVVEGWWWKSSVVCHDALQEMLQGCRDAGLTPYIASAYRTHADQVWLFNRKVNQYLSAGYSQADATRLAGTIVAVPGTSEHELGLAFDLVDDSYRNLDEAQENTAVQKWLMENSWRYGFILRYPNEKSEITGIIYEPWHYRYVGKTVAKEIYDSGLCLEEYMEMLTEG